MAEELPFRKEIEFVYGEAKTLAPGIVRIVANNPSPFTYKGFRARGWPRPALWHRRRQIGL
jgi:hypothetical protein